MKNVNSLKHLFPDIAKEWDYEKNKGISLDEIRTYSNKKVWWRCKNGHSWEAVVYTRTKMKCGCPYCSGKKILVGYNDFATLYPELAEQWDYEKNGKNIPSDFSGKSGYMAYWKCKKGHSWKTSIHGRAAQNSGCPYCSGHYVMKGENDLESQFPNIVKEWDWEKNKKKPSEVRDFSTSYVYWKCEKCHSSWRAQVAKRTIRNQGCPYCSGRYATPGKTDILTTNPEIMYLWDYEKNNAEGIFPQNIKAHSDKYANWKCEYGHTWKTMAKTIIRGRRCPICNGTTLKEGINDIATVAPELIPELHPVKNGNLTPNKIAAHSGKKIWWQCINGHEWKATPDKRSNGRNCPYCSRG